MKKNVLLLLFLFSIMGGYSQCIRTLQNPGFNFVSNNLGFSQQITAYSYSNEFSQLSGLIVGTDYLFNYKQGNSNKYITVTDWSNNVIAHGESPLTVQAITSTQIRLHYSENVNCSYEESDNTASIMALLTCPTPINYTVSDIYSTTATFNWEAQGEESAWQVLVVPQGTTPPTASTTGLDVTVDSFYTYTNLTPGTKYQFYVRANCGNEFSPWNGALSFTTECEQVTSFFQNFSTTAFAQLPVCWNQVRNGIGSSQSSYARVSTSVGTGSSPYRSVQLYNANATTTANLILTATQVSNLNAGTHRLKFFARAGAGTQSLQFGTMNQSTVDGTFTVLETINIVGNTFQEYIVDYTAYQGTDSFIAIRHNGTQFSSIYLDDISWELAPLCTAVSELEIPAATLQPESATIVWQPNGSETAWDVVFGPASVTDPSTLIPVSPAPSNNPETVLTNLTENTTYKVWVRSVCEGNLGSWIGPETFKTTCYATDVINENFDSYAYNALPDCWSAVKNGEGVSQYAQIRVINYNTYEGNCTFQIANSNSPSTTNLLFVSPELTNLSAGTHRLKFYAKSSGVAGSLQLGTINTPTSNGTFTIIETIALTANYTEYSVDFTTTNDIDSYVAFRFNTAEQNQSIFIDNVIWEPIPSCPDVTAITVSEVTTSTSIINWTSGDETQWDIVYGPTTVTDPNTLTPIAPAPSVTPEATLTALTENTSYKVWVRSVCGIQNGAWIGPITFKTPCVSINTLDENFDNTAYGNLPSCWSSVKNGVGVSATAYAKVIDFDYYSESRVARIYNDNATATTSNVMLVSPNLGNVAAGTHRVKFFAKSSGDTGSLQVGTVNNTTSNAVFSEMNTIDLTSTYAAYTVNFSSYNGTDTFLAFRHNTNTPFTSVYIDDIIWEMAPLCADITSLTAVATSVSSVEMNWSAGGTEANWQVAYGDVNATDPSLLIPSAVLTTNYYTINELEVATTYTVWVRSVCGTENGAWVGPKTVTTLCMAATIEATTMESFEFTVAEQLPACWDTEVLIGTNNWKAVTTPFGDINASASGSKILYKDYDASTAVLYSLPFNFSTITAATPIRINTYLHRHLSADATDKYTVYANTTPSLVGAQLLLEQFSKTTVQPVVGSTGFYNFLINIPELFYGQEEVYLILVGYTADGSSSYALGIDDFKVEYAPNLSNSDFDTTNVSYYPNPVKEVLTLTSTQNISSIVVYNLLGQKVSDNSVNATSAKIDMSALSKGSYIVKVTSENQTKTIKVIKE
ncbi:choice-of-anchor J domain-containing protein [Flavobacterium sp. SM2513]|uniref:choice-of-anchor J domain-containing protein n=1 Tax=Flavobacterium sp. SM2513 TaxID=3424766 RepID=UPI003D7F78F8